MTLPMVFISGCQPILSSRYFPTVLVLSHAYSVFFSGGFQWLSSKFPTSSILIFEKPEFQLRDWTKMSLNFCLTYPQIDFV